MDLHRLCAAVARPDATPRFEPARTGDVLRSVLDVSHTGRELGWQAAVALTDGLARTWAWLAQE